MIKFYSLLLGASLILVVGCGKKISNGESRKKPTSTIDTILAEEEIYLRTQKVLCESKISCPDYLTKIVVFENRKPKICTGFLVKEDIVATASTCLPKVLRLKNQNCKGDVTLFFPETRQYPSERVDCEQVLFSSDPQGSDPVLWRDNLSFIKLSSKILNRNFLKIDKNGISDQKQLSFWYVDQVDSEIGFLRKKTCLPVFNSYINPFSTNLNSPNQLLSKCAATTTAVGSPVVNENGAAVGLVSNSLPQELKKYLESTGLLTAPLAPMLFATNFACAPTPTDSRAMDPKECFKPMSESDLNTKRNNLISNESFFEKEKMAIESKLDQSNIFLKFKVVIEASQDLRIFKIQPWCFKNLNNWLWRVNSSRGNYGFGLDLPQVKMKRNMDSFGHIGSEYVMDLSQDVYVEFSVKQLKKSKTSDVVLWNEVLSDRFLTINTLCQ